MDEKNAPNDIATLFKLISNIAFFCGLPDIWKENVDHSKWLVKFHKVWRMTSNVVISIFIGLQMAAFFTQKNMTEKQRYDSLVFSSSQPLLFSYILSAELTVAGTRTLTRELVLELKHLHNDARVQQLMIWKSKFNTSGFTCMFMTALISYGIEGAKLAITGEGTFTTVITYWPDTTDRSAEAGAARVVFYVIWWVFMLRVAGVYATVIPMTICLSHQYKNLQTYFYSLNQIFQENIPQEAKEMKYLEYFKMGIRMHSHTLWCTKKFQSTYGLMFSAQILVNVSVLVMLMVQLMRMERTATAVAPTVSTGVSLLIGTGVIMCNAGDITVESGELSTAVYCSGWHECRAAAARRLVAVTVAQAQKPVVIWALGTVPLSYQSYVSIVKSSYSVFSVIY